MQDFMWQANMRSVVLSLRDYLSVLLNAAHDTAADADSVTSSSEYVLLALMLLE